MSVCDRCKHPDHTGKVCHCRCRHPWPQTPNRVTTFRQSEDQAADVELVARIDGIPASELMRDAVAEHIARRRADPEFQARLRERIDKDQAILDRLT